MSVHGRDVFEIGTQLTQAINPDQAVQDAGHDASSVMKSDRFVAAVNDTKSTVTMIVHPSQRQRQGHPQPFQQLQ
ncbi:hypothetical protein CDV31_000589 [Fusarium ambrosium]|uniref:Uncharacterized protein n=1 Tax=Fusarium ambrosium TaxID=131363 RepID=A0A428V267_9HYPO|nr:hypothetical protein CDV31_000589 [Fusarium ambrosium]